MLDWCDEFYLKFNVCQTKEVVLIDFRKHIQSP